MTSDALAAAIACGITIVIFAPYLRRIRRGELHPRAASWVVWALSTLLVGAGQLAAGGGWGAAPILLSGACSGLVAVLAWQNRNQHADGRHSRTVDRWCLAIALACLPLWIATGDPLWSVLILTGIDLLGFVQTSQAIRRDPQAESVLLFTAFALRNAISIAALDVCSLTTVVFPATIGLACAATALAIVITRRHRHPPHPATGAPAP